jgi:hypothetical protein
MEGVIWRFNVFSSMKDETAFIKDQKTKKISLASQNVSI